MRTANKRLQMFLLKLNSIFFPTSSTDPPYLTSWHQRSPGRVSLVSHRYCPQLTNRHLQPSLTLGINILLLSHSSVRHQGFNSQLLETSLISGLSQVINQQSGSNCKYTNIPVPGSQLITSRGRRLMVHSKAICSSANFVEVTKKNCAEFVLSMDCNECEN